MSWCRLVNNMPMEQHKKVTFRGGSRIGWVNRSIPFASLEIDDQKIRLRNTLGRDLLFYPEDLVAIEEVFYVPFIAQGIRIRHRVRDTNSRVIFWSFSDPRKIMQLIQSRGLVSPDGNKVDASGSDPSFSAGKGFKISPFLAGYLVLILLFGCFLVYKSVHKYDDYQVLRKTSEVSIPVEEMSVDHGDAVLNDSILVPGGTKLVSEQSNWFRHKHQPLFGGPYRMKPGFAALTPPFQLHKGANTFELLVIKYEDSLKFRMPDPDFKDPKDPTFKDVYDRLFGG